jgi:hypothetical protein
MKIGMNLTVAKGAVAVAAILAMSGSALAKKPASLGGSSATLSSDRKTVIVNATPRCMQSTVPGSTLSADYSVYIFQSHGRLINIGIGTDEGDCSAAKEITVEAIEGLTFQPGPATMIIKVTTYETVTTSTPSPTTGQPPVVTTSETPIGTFESGAKINLH